MSARAVQRESEVTIRATGHNTTVFRNFPNRTLYALRCTMQTSLGLEIAAAAIPCAGFIIPFANKFKYVTTYLTRLSLLLLAAIFILTFLEQMNVLHNSYWTDWVIRVAAGCGIIYMIPLVFVYFFCIYVPLRATIMPIALVFPVSDAGERNNEFLEISYNERITAVDIDFTNHMFAARLQQFAKIKIMVYETKWIENNLNFLFCILDFAACLFFIIMWFLTDVMSLDRIAKILKIDFDFTGVMRPILIALACYLVPTALYVVINLAWTLVFCTLNIILCFLPDKFVKCLHDRACRKVLDNVDNNRAPMVSFVED